MAFFDIISCGKSCHIFLFVSGGMGQTASASPQHFRDVFKNRVSNAGLPWEKTRRSLAEENNQSNSILILAARRTHRADPIDHFNKYNGGFNISNEHYWASVALTAAPFFVIAIVWFILFVGCIVLYTGEGKFHSSTSNTLDYVVHTANNTSESLKNVSVYLDATRGVGVNGITIPADAIKAIDDLDDKINSSANTLSSVTANNKDKIQNGLDDICDALFDFSWIIVFHSWLGVSCILMDKFGQRVEFRLSKLQQNKDLKFTGFSQQMLFEVCIFSGCDYLPSISEMGLKRAHALSTKFKSYDKGLRFMRLFRFKLWWMTQRIGDCGSCS